MKKAISVLKSLWFFMMIILIIVDRRIYFPVLVLLVCFVLFTPLMREFKFKADLDERQIYISHYSSHIAFYVFSTLMISVIFINFIRVGKNTTNLWYILLIVPLLSKLFTSLLMTYRAGNFVSEHAKAIDDFIL